MCFPWHLLRFSAWRAVTTIKQHNVQLRHNDGYKAFRGGVGFPRCLDMPLEGIGRGLVRVACSMGFVVVMLCSFLLG